jgi:prepilin-type N-terminal cleavage/methylation domain-containing protein
MENILKRSSKTRAGFSLTEVAIVMGVMAIILAGVWGLVSRGWESQKQQQASDQIRTVVGNVRSYYAGQAGVPYSVNSVNSLAATLLANGAIPANMQRNPGTSCTPAPCADNPWGTNSGDPQGSFRVCNWLGAWDPSGSPPLSTACPNGSATTPPITNFFGIELSGLTKSSCIAMTQLMTASTAPTGLVDVVIIGSATLDLGTTQVSVATAQSDCNAATANGNALIFVYQLFSGN